eukprot:31061-Pelagococcus_subviridis.AAC.7
MTTSPSSVLASSFSPRCCRRLPPPPPPPPPLPPRRPPTPMTSFLNVSDRCPGENSVVLIPRGKNPIRSRGTPISARCSAAAYDGVATTSHDE